MTKDEQRELDRVRVAKRREAARLPEAPAINLIEKPNSKGLKTDPDDFKGFHEPSYYKNLCMFCGCPETKLMSRNGFSGYLCEAHSFE